MRKRDFCTILKEIIKDLKKYIYIYRDGWMEALADKVHRQEEHIFHNIATFHTTTYPYISSSELCQL